MLRFSRLGTPYSLKSTLSISVHNVGFDQCAHIEEELKSAVM